MHHVHHQLWDWRFAMPLLLCWRRLRYEDVRPCFFGGEGGGEGEGNQVSWLSRGAKNTNWDEVSCKMEGQTREWESERLMELKSNWNRIGMVLVGWRVWFYFILLDLFLFFCWFCWFCFCFCFFKLYHFQSGFMCFLFLFFFSLCFMWFFCYWQNYLYLELRYVLFQYFANGTGTPGFYQVLFGQQKKGRSA